MKPQGEGFEKDIRTPLPESWVVTSPRRNAVMGSLLKNAIYRQVTEEDLMLLTLWEAARPESFRAFDQIPMQGSDLLSQVKLIAPLLKGKRVAFVGDHDGTSVLLGLLSSHGLLEGPEQMTLLDFDERLLDVASSLAVEHGFVDRFVARLYNVFDPLPQELIRSFTAFYTNPPYGASNLGASARLFITRGCELVEQDVAEGYILLPMDDERTWTRASMLATQSFLISHGWSITAHVPQMHRYHLEDDATLMSSLLCMKREAALMPSPPMTWQGRAVSQTEIPYFYGKDVLPPFPSYIALDGSEINVSDIPSDGENL